MLRKLLVVVSVASSLLASTGAARAGKSLTIGTAAAPDSLWGQAFSDWKKAVDRDGKGAVTLDVKYGSTQGSESTMVDKLKAGQLAGAGLSSAGLARINRNLTIPGSLNDWAKLDKVRAALGPEFEKMLGEAGLTLATWGDVGYAHFLSKGFAVRVPDDLKGKNPWIYGDDPVLKTFYSKVGGVNPFSSELMAVGANVDNGRINCLLISALAAEMLQWSAKFDNGVDAVNGIVLGAVVLSTDALGALPADVRKMLLEYGKGLAYKGSTLSARIRAEDAAAWTRFKSRSGVKILVPSADDKAKWVPIFKAARDSLKGTTFNAALIDRVEAAAK